jgi:hypothetical protein
VDEVVIKVKKWKARRWGCIDRVTKFKISVALTKWRSYEDGAKPLFENLKHHTGGHIIQKQNWFTVYQLRVRNTD